MKQLHEITEQELEQELRRRKKEKEKQINELKKQHEAEKEEFLEYTLNKFQHYHDSMIQLKENTINEAERLYEQIWKMRGKEPKEVSSFQIVNEDYTRKVVIEKQERFAFTEEAAVAITQIKEFFRSKFQARSKQVYDLLDALLMKNKAGDYDPKLLTKLRKQVTAIDNKELTEAFELLESCQTVVGSSMYARAYKKNGNDKWQDVVLQFSAL
jgi:hypothetical protein